MWAVAIARAVVQVLDQMLVPEIGRERVLEAGRRSAIGLRPDRVVAGLRLSRAVVTDLLSSRAVESDPRPDRASESVRQPDRSAGSVRRRDRALQIGRVCPGQATARHSNLHCQGWESGLGQEPDRQSELCRESRIVRPTGVRFARWSVHRQLTAEIESTTG